MIAKQRMLTGNKEQKSEGSRGLQQEKQGCEEEC